MHKFLRAAGFSMYTKKKDIEKLLDLLERQPSVTKCVQVDEESNVCEMRTEVAPGLGISIVGELKEEGNFEREFYFPYLESDVGGSTEECSVQRHTEKETYAGMVDENKVGISLIFYIQNFLDFSAGILIVSAVDQPDIVITYAINADFGRGIDVIGIFCDLHQFIHGQNLLCFCFCGTLSHALQGDNPLDLICKNCVFARNY